MAEGLSFGGCLVELAPVGDPGRRSRGDRLRARPAGPDPARRADRRAGPADRARQLRARHRRRRRGGRGPVAALPGPAPPRHEPRGAAGRRRDHLARAAAGGRRRRPALRGTARRAAGAAIELADDQRRGHRRHLRPARRAAAGHRAGRRPHPSVPDRTDRRPAQRPVPPADRWVSHRPAPPADAARRRRLELRAPLRRRAARLRTAVRVPRRLRPRRPPRPCAPTTPSPRPTSPTTSTRSSTSRWWSPFPSVGGLRFTQLQTLAQYGRERLTERGDAVRIRDAMAEHFAAAVLAERRRVHRRPATSVADGDGPRSTTTSGPRSTGPSPTTTPRRPS